MDRLKAFLNRAGKRTIFYIAFNALLALGIGIYNYSVLTKMRRENILDDKSLVALVVASTVFCISSVSISIFYTRMRSKNKELPFYKKYGEVMEENIKELRRQKHNFDNILASLYGYVQMGRIEEFRNMTGELLENEEGFDGPEDRGC